MSIVNEHQPIRPQSAIKAPVRPRISNIDNFTQDELFQIAQNDNSSSASFQCLIELVRRTTEKNQELVEKVIVLEQEVKNLQMALNTPKKSVKKCKQFYTTFCYTPKHKKCDKYGFLTTFIAFKSSAGDGT